MEEPEISCWVSCFVLDTSQHGEKKRRMFRFFPPTVTFPPLVDLNDRARENVAVAARKLSICRTDTLLATVKNYSVACCVSEGLRSGAR